MVVGVMQVEIAIDWSQSLKDKRRVVRSLRDALHRHHMVSVSEVGDHDILNRATLGIAGVGASGSAIGVTLDRVLQRIRERVDCEVAGVSRQLLHGWGASFDEPPTHDGVMTRLHSGEHAGDTSAITDAQLAGELTARAQRVWEEETQTEARAEPRAVPQRGLETQREIA